MLRFLFAQVCHTIEKELGKSTKELFLDFDENPLATASVRSLRIDVCARKLVGCSFRIEIFIFLFSQGVYILE